jgi:uncharacterized protein (DUF302 family)
MLFHEINHSQWLPVYGITQRVLRLIFGNPIIAFTMMRDDLTAGLFAPVEVLLVEHHNQEGCTVVYNPPSALVAAESPLAATGRPGTRQQTQCAHQRRDRRTDARSEE